MAYLTPNDDATLISRVIFVPDDLEWLALFWGLMMTLTDSSAWEEYGAMTPDEAAERWREALEVSYNANPHPG